MQIQEIEKEHKQTVLRLQHDVEEKEKALAAEFAEAEQVYKTNEHDLRERLDEKAQIIEVLYSNFLKQVPHVYLDVFFQLLQALFSIRAKHCDG